MEYRQIDPTINTLYLVKQSLFDGEYLLTDHTRNFGQLLYDGLERQRGAAYAANQSWKFEYDFEFFGKREILIYDDQNNLLGNVIKHYGDLSDFPTLVMTNGFKATFSSVGLFTHEWISPKLGRLLHIKSPALSLTDTITLYHENIPYNMAPLLCFLAEHILIMKSRSNHSHPY